MPLPWMKMWIEALDDPKLTRLSLAERGAWWGLLNLAGKCETGDKSGKIQSGGQGLDIDEIVDALHIKNSKDRQALESMIAKMEKRGSLVWNGDVLTVVHWEKRQKISPSARPDAVAERVRQHREREREKKHKPIDPMLAERQNRIGVEYKKRRKELGRELTTEERLDLEAEIERQLEEKYGGKIEDARSG
ncbi:hypothetical protein ES703_04921 [subsurface metagenome]